MVKRYAELARLPDVSPHDLSPHDLSPHDLRHRFGYRLAAAAPMHRVPQLMGHDSLDTTMLYMRGTKADLQREVEKIAWA